MKLTPILVIAAALALTACSSTQQRTINSDHTCNIEYSNYQATVIGYCQEVPAILPANVPTIEKTIEITDVNTIPEVFSYSKLLKFSLVKQKQAKAPLVFVIAGTGAAYNSSKMLTLQKALYQQGYHVISISSPTYSNFIINATTHKDIPGYLSKDAETLYHVMQMIYQQVKDEDDINASSFSLTGYSLGGSHSAFVAQLDEQKKIFNFEKVLLINPSVNLYHSVGILDSYLDFKNNQSEAVAMVNDIFDQIATSYDKQQSASLNEDVIYPLFKDANLTITELKFLIGVSFRMSSVDMLFALDMALNTGGLNYKNHKIRKFESLTEPLIRANSITFTDYFNHVIVKWTQKEDPNITREQLIEELSLKSIENYLRNSKKIHVVTNADDIILAKGEVEYLQDVFGDRAHIFKRGGHCGNMDRESFIAHLNTQFTGNIQ